MFVGITDCKMTGLYPTHLVPADGETLYQVDSQLFDQLRANIRLWRYVKLVGVTGILVPKLINAPLNLPTLNFDLTVGTYDPQLPANVTVKYDDTVSSNISNVGFFVTNTSPLICFGSTVSKLHSSITKTTVGVDYAIVFNSNRSVEYNIHLEKVFIDIAGHDPELMMYNITQLHPLLSTYEA